MSTCEWKRRRETYSDWSNLPSDLLMNIFDGFKVAELNRMKSVCRSWQSVAQSLLKSKLPKYPILLLPDVEQYESVYIMSLLESLFLHIQINSCCFGSSRGWLLLQEMGINLALWNPILDVKIRLLPSITSLPTARKNLLYRPIWKAVLCCSSPLISRKYGVVVIFEHGTLAYAMVGDSKWSVVDDANTYYVDLTSHNDLVIAISNIGVVDAWDFSTFTPVKKMNVTADFPQNIPEFMGPLHEYYIRQIYVVMSKSEILLVVRCVSRVDPSGLLLEEADRYRTKNFYVYKLDSRKDKWILVENLGNQVLFVGENESRACSIEHMPMLQKNSIYFTDDILYVMDEDKFFDGHDIGIFHLEDSSIQRIYNTTDHDYDFLKMSPVFWTVPC